VERVRAAAAREVETGHDARYATSEDGHGDGKQQERCVDADVVNPCQPGRAECREQPDAAPRDENAERSASQRQYNAFGEKLPDQARPVGAERPACADFLLSGGPLHEQQAGDVRAGNQKNQADRDLQKRERLPSVAVVRRIQWFDHESPSRIALGKFLLEIARDGIEVCLRLLRRYAGLEATDHGEDARRPPQLSGIERLRDPEVRLEEQIETLGHDTHDRGVRVVEDHRAVDHGGIPAESCLPQAMTDQRKRHEPANAILSLDKSAPELRLHPEHRKHAGFEALACEPFGRESILRRTHREDAVVHRADRLERAILFLECDVFGNRDPRRRFLTGSAGPDADQPVHVGKRRFIEGRLEQSKNGGVGADADGNHQHNGGGNGFPGPDMPERQRQIFTKCLHHEATDSSTTRPSKR
jgi:hypothetical protein